MVGLLSGLGRSLNYSKVTKDVKMWYGQHENGVMDGIGTINSNYLGTYLGEFKNCCLNGVGRRTSPDGLVYIGEWRNGRSNGKGI